METATRSATAKLCAGDQRPLGSCVSGRGPTMSDSISMDQPDAGHIVDPPIVDFLCHEPELKAFVAEFVPEKVFSTERKESVFLYDGTDSSRRVRELLAELSLVCGARSPITKLAHGGGGNFSMYSADGALIELHDSP